jgi:hypothetical protein
MILKMGELWIYQRWTHIPEWSYARQFSWVGLANNLSGWQIIFEKVENSKWTQSRVAMWKIFGSGSNVYVLRNLSTFIQLRSIS